MVFKESLGIQLPKLLGKFYSQIIVGWLQARLEYDTEESCFDIKKQVSELQILSKLTCPKLPLFRNQQFPNPTRKDGKDGSQKAVVLLQIYQSIASCSLPGKRVSLGVCKRLAGLEGYNLLASNDPTRNWTCCLFTAAEGWAEIKEGGSIPLERVWSRGWAAPREKTWERRSVGCMLGWIHVAP